MVSNESYSREKVLKILDQITDPEIPVLRITDLGIVREVETDGGQVRVTITPTYSGCPAMDVISMQIKMELLSAGFQQVEVIQQLAPAWTTDWMTERGKAQLQQYGIAPPLPRQQVCSPDRFASEEAVPCPRCRSHHTHRISEFGSTACKALYQCDDCLEPFDYFKCH